MNEINELPSHIRLFSLLLCFSFGLSCISFESNRNKTEKKFQIVAYLVS